MKRILLLSLVWIGMISMLEAQTIVGTSPENKNVVLEEFTGIHCTYCPDGHAIAQAIYDAHPNDVVLINVHTGPYASPGTDEPDFRTPWGDAIAAQSGLTGYPAGTVNRHLFPGMSQGSGTAMSRGSWSSASNQILAAPSYLNVGCEAVVTAAGQLTVQVEVYYTGDSPLSSNFLNVAILQNNILGPQTGGGMGNNYNHMHMLRHLITGQWGVEITETTEGSLFSQTFTYDIPADYNDVPVVLDDLDIVAFVTETHQEIVSGIKGTLVMEAAYDYDATVSEVMYPITQACAGELSPRIELKNYGDITLTSVNMEYSINGGDVYSYQWTGNLPYTATQEINLPGIPFTEESTNTLNISLSNPNGMTDENPSNDESVTNFEIAPETSMNIEMQLFVGAWGSDISWEFFNGNGEMLAEGSGYDNNEVINMQLPIDNSGCFTFYLYDSGNDGFAGGGYLKLYDEGTVFSYITTQLESVIDIPFTARNPLMSPQEFDAAANGYDINFTWTAPSKAVLQGYNIYEVGDMATPINTSLITGTSYIFTVAGNGNYEFYLQAVYDEGNSDLVGPVFADINVGIGELNEKGFSVYPNPVTSNSSINFTLKQKSEVAVTVYNMVGARVLEIPAQELSAGKQTINLSSSELMDGVYFINLTIGGQSITKKISVLK